MAQAGDPEWNEEEAHKRDVRAITTQAVREKRREIIRQIRKIQPQAGKNLKDVEVPQSLFQLARDIVRDPEASLRFNKVAVYELLLGDLNRRRRESANSGGVTLDKAVPVLDGWKLASISLFRYALNLVLAPNRAEFKKMKVSKSLPKLRNCEFLFISVVDFLLRVQHLPSPPPRRGGVQSHGLQGD